MLKSLRPAQILLVVTLALAAPAALHAGGAGEDVFVPVDVLVEQGSFDEAILELTAIMQSNAELFDVAEARLREIRTQRDAYNNNLDELITVLNPTEGEALDVERALQLITELEVIEPDPNARVERQVQEARYTLALQSDREVRQQILDQAVAQITAGEFRAALETYLGGFDLQRVELEDPDEFTRTVRLVFPEDFVSEVVAARESLRDATQTWREQQPALPVLGAELSASQSATEDSDPQARSAVIGLLDQLEGEVRSLEALRATMQASTEALLELRDRVFREFPAAQGDDDEHVQYLVEFAAGIAQPDLDVGILAAVDDGRYADLGSASETWLAGAQQIRQQILDALGSAEWQQLPGLLDRSEWTNARLLQIAGLQEGIVLDPQTVVAGADGGTERNAAVVRSAGLQRALASQLEPAVAAISRSEQLDPAPLEQPEDPEGEVTALNELRTEQQEVRAVLDSVLQNFLSLTGGLPAEPSEADAAVLAGWQNRLEGAIQRTRENEVLTVLRLADLGATPLQDQLVAAVTERERSRSVWFVEEEVLTETGEVLTDPVTGERETATRAYPDRVLSGQPAPPESGPAGAVGAVDSLQGVIRSASELLEVLDTEGGFVVTDERFTRIRSEIGALLSLAQEELADTEQLVSEAQGAVSEAAEFRIRYNTAEAGLNTSIGALEGQVQRRAISAPAARSRITELRSQVQQTQSTANRSLDVRWLPAFNREASAEIGELGTRLGALDQQIGLLEINDLYQQARASYEQGQDDGNLTFLERAQGIIGQAIELRENLFPGNPDRSLITLQARITVAIEFLDDTDVRPGDSLYPIVNARLSQGNTLLERARTASADRGQLLSSSQERFEEVLDIQSRNRDARLGLLRTNLVSNPAVFPDTYQSLVGEAVEDGQAALNGPGTLPPTSVYDEILDLLAIGEEYLRTIGANQTVSAGLQRLSPLENSLAIALGLREPPPTPQQIQAIRLIAEAQRLWDPLRPEFTGPPALDRVERALSLWDEVPGGQTLSDTVQRSLNLGTTRALTLQPPSLGPEWLANAQRLIANGTLAFGDLRRLWSYTDNRSNPEVRSLVGQFVQANPGFRDQFPGL